MNWRTEVREYGGGKRLGLFGSSDLVPDMVVELRGDGTGRFDASMRFDDPVEMADAVVRLLEALAQLEVVGEDR